MQMQDFPFLSLEEVLGFIEAEGVLIDTLPAAHFEGRHIPGAVNACVYEVVFLETVAGLVPDKKTPVVLYGAGPNSHDCFAGADKMLRAGYSDVAVFPGGLDEWREQGRSLDGLAPDEVEPPHPVLELDSRKYTLLPDQSHVVWTGRNTSGGHTGTVGLSSGELDATGSLVGEFVIDMTSIKNTNLEGDELQPVLEAHLHSDDFFFTNLFPEATFSTTQVKLVEEGQSTRPNAMIQGKLSLRGISNEIAFPAHIRNLDDRQIVVLANLDFDRTQWGILYGSSRFFQHLGFHVVFDFISIDFRLVFA